MATIGQTQAGSVISPAAAEGQGRVRAAESSLKPLEVESKPQRLIQEVADKTGASIRVNQEELQAAIEELKQLSDDAGRNLGFSVDQVMNRPVVVVSDKDSGNVVRQIPAEVVVKVAHSIEQMKGILFDETF